MKAVLLIRVSDPKQERDGLSLDNQEEVLRRYAEGHEFEVVREFRFQESADRKIRTRFMEMVNFVKAHKDVQAIVCYRVDRMTRNYRDHVLMDDLRLEYDKQLHFVHDRLIITKKTVGRDIQDWDTKVYLAKQFLNRLKEDATISAVYKLRRGEWPGKAIYGYRNRKRDDGRNWIVADPFEANVVRKICEWYATGAHSLLTIRRKLKEDYGIAMSTGKVDYILNSGFYHGEMQYDGAVYPHAYETLTSRELHERILQIKGRYHLQPHKFAGLEFLYRGLMHCAHCGCAITCERKRKNGKTYHYYHCTEYKGKHGAVWLREEEVTAQFMAILTRMKIPAGDLAFLTSTLRQSHTEESVYADQLRTQLQLDWDRYENRIRRMYDDRLDNTITHEFFEERRQEYRSKQQDIKQKLGQVQGAEDAYYVDAATLLEVASNAAELFRVAKPAEKRTILKTVLSNCTLEGGNMVPELEKPYDTIFSYSNRQAWRPLLDAFRHRQIEIDHVTIPTIQSLLDLADLEAMVV